MIKKSISLLLTLLALQAPASIASPAPTTLTPLPKHGPTTTLITRYIGQVHYKKTSLDDDRSQVILDEYIDSLDPNRNIFTQKDINEFKRFKDSLDDALLVGELGPAFSMFQRYNELRVKRADYAIELLDAEHDFSVDETYQFDRSEAEWPKTETEINDLWRKRVKNDILTLKLAKKEKKALKETLKKRYERLIARSNQFQAEDAYELFINAYLTTVEPHTSYFSPRTSENFKINMSLSLEGIGAVLQTDEEHTRVRRIIKGGPADLSGLIHADDRITGVGQGKEGEIVDVVGWRIDDVVDLIRGPKDSVVQLQILPKESGLDGPSKIITIVRNKVKLEEQQAKSSIMEVPAPGNSEKQVRVGVITIPTFYMDFEAAERGEKDYRSTTRDTRQLITELEKEGVKGIIVDLRSNGGGSLNEAISLTGLFIEKGPVVQIRNSAGHIKVDRDEDKSIAYSGPLAVLVDRNSASASEIFAGAIQDYNRGIIVGEPTFGKGTVQTVIDLNRQYRAQTPLGRLKITIAQFFRVNGDSTQHRGVVPDIVFPTAENNEEQGERSLENALPWAAINAADFKPFQGSLPDLSETHNRHLKRVNTDTGFNYLLTLAEVRHKAEKKTTVSLHEEKRRQEREDTEQERLERINRFRESVGLPPEKSGNDDDDDDSIADNEADEKLVDEITKIQVKETASILVDTLLKSGAKNALSQHTQQ